MNPFKRFFNKSNTEQDTTDRYLSALPKAPTKKAVKNWIQHAANSIPQYQLNNLRQRSREITQRDPVAAALMETLISSVIGTGLTVQSNISADDLGVSETKAEKIRNSVEGAFKDWAENDAERGGNSDFVSLQRIAFRTLLVDGETFALPGWYEAPHRDFGRCVQLLTADDLYSNGSEEGIRLDPFGTPQEYLFKTYKTNGAGFRVQTNEPKVVPARDGKGRPLVIHLYEAHMPNQTRGLPLLTPAMDMFTHLADYTEAEVVGARTAAALSVFVTKQDDYSSAEAHMDDNGEAVQELIPGMVSYLRPGESISTVAPKRAEGFSAFLTQMTRIIAASTGLPYELLLKDFSKTNFSSGRMAALESRRVFNRYRQIMIRMFCQPLYASVIEEACMREMIPITPRQLSLFKRKLLKSTWNGPKWGSIDPMKESNAAVMRIQAGLSTHSEELAKLGRDWGETYTQLAREKEMRERLDLDLLTDIKPESGEKNDGEEPGKTSEPADGTN